jgi:RNA polymerase sigma-70 factor (ECF subfamily)
VEKTAVLLSRIVQGDVRAQSELERAVRPRLQQFAHGRLPPYARGIGTTHDLVAEALAKSFAAIDGFELRHEGAFLAFARKTLMNGIVDQIRRARARPQGSELNDQLPSGGPSPVDDVMGHEFMERYEEALTRLTPEQHQAVHLRIELGYSFTEVAEAMEAPSADSARMLVNRALLKLAEELRPFAPGD